MQTQTTESITTVESVSNFYQALTRAQAKMAVIYEASKKADSLPSRDILVDMTAGVSHSVLHAIQDWEGGSVGFMEAIDCVIDKD